MAIPKHHLENLVSEADVQRRVKELGAQITTDYAESGATLILVGVLKGSFMFLADLVRHIELPMQLAFTVVSCYASNTVPNGEVRMLYDLDCSLEGNDVIVVEDIIDSGNTLSYLLQMYAARNPKSLKLCTMLDKPSRRIVPVDVAYTGFSIKNEFAVGYGMDYAGMYRNLKNIAKVVFD